MCYFFSHPTFFYDLFGPHYILSTGIWLVVFAFVSVNLKCINSFLKMYLQIYFSMYIQITFFQLKNYRVAAIGSHGEGWGYFDQCYLIILEEEWEQHDEASAHGASKGSSLGWAVGQLEEYCVGPFKIVLKCRFCPATWRGWLCCVKQGHCQHTIIFFNL